VQEQVSLRQEHVHVERRPIDRAAQVNEDFRDRTIEASERSEQAVVSKEARVKEEVVVNKDVRDRTETVSDTVRRTEVEVEDDRTGASRTGTTDRDRR
jgi:stress response protein YsnF